MAAPPEGGDQLGNRRAFNARIHTNNGPAESHQGPSISRTDTTLSFAITNQSQGDGHGGVFLVSQCVGGAFVHADNIRSLHNVNSWMPIMQKSLELAPDSHQDETQGFIFTHRCKGRSNYHYRPPIATHRVNRYGDRLRRSSTRLSVSGAMQRDYSSLASITCLPR